MRTEDIHPSDIKRRGRPKKEVTRSVGYRLRLFPNEMILVREIADSYHMNVSDVIRTALNIIIDDPELLINNF